MKNWLKENWFKVGLLTILVISVAAAFYWYEWRPTQIRKECSKVCTGVSSLGGIGGNCRTNYQTCLQKNGLEK